MRLRPAWREAKQARKSRVGKAPGGTAPDGTAPDGTAVVASGPETPGGKPGGTKATGAKATRLPSRARVLANVIAGLVVTVASLAALINR